VQLAPVAQRSSQVRTSEIGFVPGKFRDGKSREIT
jgi:hypothetical protein